MKISWKNLVGIVGSILVIVVIVFIFMHLEKQRMLKKTELIIHGPTMETYYDIRIVMSEMEKHGIDVYDLKDKIDKKLLSVEKIASTYREDSEISYVNANKSSSWIKISKELYTLIKESEKISILSNGLYDVTVGKLLNLWDFGRDKISLGNEVPSVPSKSKIKEVLKSVGYKKIKLKTEKGEFYLKKLNKDIWISLSSIIKGYGMDEISKLLIDLSYKDHKIEIGGQILVKGQNQDSKNWELKIERPHLNNVEGDHTIEISDLAVATSGIYKKYLQYGDKIYTDIIDANTGYPVENRVISVSVLSKNYMSVGVLATALFFMGVEKGLELAEKQSIPVYYMYLDDNKNLSEKWNEEFGKYLVKNKD